MRQKILCAYLWALVRNGLANSSPQSLQNLGDVLGLRDYYTFAADVEHKKDYLSAHRADGTVNHLEDPAPTEHLIGLECTLHDFDR
jgi:hypothetical protein